MLLLTGLFMALGARINVIHYEDRFVAVNKPAGISTHRNKDTGRRRVMTTQLQRQFRRKVFPAHRLDHRTSGCIIFGFDGEAAHQCHERLAEGEKEYLALLRGCDWPSDDDEVVVEKEVKGDNGVYRPAVTTFRRLASQEDPRCTLVLAMPKTGRPHQIRKHAQFLSMPIIGDSKHGDSKVNRWWRESRGLDRLALHCLSIRLPRTDDAEERTLVAPLLDDDLATALKREPLWEAALRLDPRLDALPVDVRSGSLGDRPADRPS